MELDTFCRTGNTSTAGRVVGMSDMFSSDILIIFARIGERPCRRGETCTVVQRAEGKQQKAGQGLAYIMSL